MLAGEVEWRLCVDERILLKWLAEKRCKILKRKTLECRKACFGKSNQFLGLIKHRHGFDRFSHC
jgi:hypothetical protein